MARFSHLFDKMHRTRHTLVAWLAVFALFAQMLAPLSSALAFDADTDGEFHVICTASGVKTVAIGEDGKPVKPVQGMSCPLCLTYAAAALVPSVVSFTGYTQRTHSAFALPHADAAANLWRAQPQLPRGPPQAA